MRKRNKGRRNLIFKVIDENNNLLHKCFNKYDAQSRSNANTHIETVRNK